MSRSESAEADSNAAICNYCGFVIDEPQKECVALETGVCRP